MSDPTPCCMTQRLKDDYTFVPEIDIHTSDLSKIPGYIKRLNDLRSECFDSDYDKIAHKLYSSGDWQGLSDFETMTRSEIDFLDEVIDFLEQRLNRTSSPTSKSQSEPVDP